MYTDSAKEKLNILLTANVHWRLTKIVLYFIYADYEYKKKFRFLLLFIMHWDIFT